MGVSYDEDEVQNQLSCAKISEVYCYEKLPVIKVSNINC